MTDLIQRIEAAKEPRRELFEEAYDALPHAHKGGNNYARFAAMLDAQAWTSAAEMLVPDGWTGIIPISPNEEAWLWPEGGTMHRGYRVNAAHPSLALLSAILRAERKDDHGTDA